MMIEPKDVPCKSNLLSCTIEMNSGSKSRQHLTEAEKEARRLRRVLANRESARQTIRRRQAMFEELARKAADLAVENDNLKKDKELAMKEYESLRSTNDCLKEQIAEVERKSKPSNSEISSSLPTPTPSFPFNPGSVVPFHWPMMFQPSDVPIQQCQTESGIATPPVPMMQLWKPDSFLGQGNVVTVANSGTLLCMVPFSCFFPVHALGSSGHSQSSELNEKQIETSTFHQCSGSASSKQMMNGGSFFPLKIERQVSTSAGSTSTNDAYQAGLGFPPDGSNEEERAQQGMVLVPAPLNCIRPVASIGPFTALHQDDDVSVPPAVEHTAKSLSQDTEEETVQHCKQVCHPVAAAEARKRRKELIKLKSLHAHES